jgi:hypothetical protein
MIDGPLTLSIIVNKDDTTMFIATLLKIYTLITLLNNKLLSIYTILIINALT